MDLKDEVKEVYRIFDGIRILFDENEELNGEELIDQLSKLIPSIEKEDLVDAFSEIMAE